MQFPEIYDIQDKRRVYPPDVDLTDPNRQQAMNRAVQAMPIDLQARFIRATMTQRLIMSLRGMP